MTSTARPRTRSRAGLAILLALSALPGCARLPARPAAAATAPPPATVAEAGSGALASAVAQGVREHPALTGIHPLREAGEALAARLQLVAAATRSVDLQYYIWHDDASGRLLFDALRAAAARGVRVRLLLDDSNTAGLDATLLALDADPGIEVRLFNPFLHRSHRLLDFATRFHSVIRRMHNKSLTVDGAASIVGGRNIGDEYFGGPDTVLFEDLDVLAVGDVVGPIAASFQAYWDSPSAWPVADIVRSPPKATRATAIDDAQRSWSAEAARIPVLAPMLAGTLSMDWVPARLASDDPSKGQGRAWGRGLLQEQLQALFGTPRTRLDLVSPYFVPAVTGTRLLTGLARQGVRVRVLTNALEATDVPAAHAGYLIRRDALLKGGVQLYELRSAPAAGVAKGRFLQGSSSASLHAKTFAVDGTRVFVGSFNFDPRSARLNTEMGLVLDSPALAQGIARVFDEEVPQRAYEVRRTAGGRLEWLQRDGAAQRTLRTEPGTNAWQRFRIRLLSWLPFEWLM